MTLTLTYQFANHTELALHLSHFSNAGKAAEAPKDSKVKAAAQPSSERAAASTPQATETVSAASPAASTQSASKAASVDYEKDVKPLVIKLGATKGRDAVLAELKKFGATKGTEVPVDKLGEFKAALEAALAAESE